MRSLTDKIALIFVATGIRFNSLKIYRLGIKFYDYFDTVTPLRMNEYLYKENYYYNEKE